MVTTTWGIYEKAAQFDADFGFEDVKVEDCTLGAMRYWLQQRNEQSPFQGVGLHIEAGMHLVAHCLTDEVVGDEDFDFELVSGIFQGAFIGFNAVPFRNPLTNISKIVLGTVIEAEVAVEGEDYHRVFVTTPIPCSEIELAE